jgi:hypothetical protein
LGCAKAGALRASAGSLDATSDAPNYTKGLKTPITIHGDADLSPYTLVKSVEFDQDGQATPISWDHSDFHVDQGIHTRATLKSTASAHFGDKFDPASGTLTITLSSGGKGEDSDLPVRGRVTVSQ